MNRDKTIIDEPTLISYYCRECKKIVKGVSKGKRKKYTFDCPECGNQCCYGTAHSMIHYFRIKEVSENGQELLKMQQEKLKKLEEKASSKK